MKKLILIAVGMFAAGVYVGQSSSITNLRKAFLHHEALESPEITKYYPMMGGAEYVKSVRWANYQKQAKACPLIHEVTHVLITKTQDTMEDVVKLRGSGATTDKIGFINSGECSLWLNSDGEVRAVTSY